MMFAHSQTLSLITNLWTNEADLVHRQESRGVEAGWRASRPLWTPMDKNGDDNTAFPDGEHFETHLFLHLSKKKQFTTFTKLKCQSLRTTTRFI